MDVRRRTGLAGAVLLLFTLTAPARFALAQTELKVPAPGTPEAAAAIIRPLAEIGRVRARTPYCAALAHARPGIDAAIAFEYQAPILAADLGKFRFDSGLHKHLALKKAETDLTALWELSVAGREEVRALRTAAQADGVDEQQRQEMLAVANAVDGAKERQKQLSKSVARTIAVYAELPVRTIVNSAEDEIRGSNPFTGSTWNPGRSNGPSAVESTPEPTAYALMHPEELQQHDNAQALFNTFSAERFIRDDMEVAAKHATAAMKLGGCSPN